VASRRGCLVLAPSQFGFPLGALADKAARAAAARSATTTWISMSCLSLRLGVMSHTTCASASRAVSCHRAGLDDFV